MRARLLAPLLAAALCACGPMQDNPTQLKDLRVLAMSFEAPELMAPTCDTQDPKNLFSFAQPLRLRAFVVDPEGEGRDIAWEVLACAAVGDRTCSDPERRVVVATGTMKAGELELVHPFGTLTMPGLPGPDGKPLPLLPEVVQKDTYKGLGGIRLPVVLHVKAGGEEIYAQKLMVFSCKAFPDQAQNITPELPGLLLEGTPWGESDVPPLSGPGPFALEPEEFSGSEEPYVVSSFELKPVQLQESWTLAWYVTAGRMDREQTGGTDPDGTSVRPGNSWIPARDQPAGEVTFYVVVRDGRGGTSWYTRRALYTP
ncbi:MAG: hypothetical protein FJ086_08085 [Deltaproteobacteria bacterium]|nr:hypothetical protein [Deltaproteobacteria bacterium]